MAKPDLQEVLVTPAGELYRDDGKLGLALALDHLVGVSGVSGDTDAAASGVPVGGLYVRRATGAVTRRQS